MAELFELSERERGDLARQLEAVKKLMSSVKNLGKSTSEAVAKSLGAFKKQMMSFASETANRLQKVRKSRNFAQNGFEITYSKQDQNMLNNDLKTGLESELAELRVSVQSLTNERNSIKNVNNILLEKLKMAEEKIKKLQERIAAPPAESSNSNLQKLTKTALSGEKTDTFSKTSELLQGGRTRFQSRDHIDKPQEDFLTPKNTRNSKPAKEYPEDLYIARYKHEEALEEATIKLKNEHLKELQKLKDEYEVRLNQEISKELERELEVFEKQQKLFEERQLQNEKSERNKAELIAQLESELNHLKTELALIMENQPNMQQSRNFCSSSVNAGNASRIDSLFKSPLRPEQTYPLADVSNNMEYLPEENEELIADLRHQIAQLDSKLREAIETIEQDQIAFESFRVIKEELEARNASLTNTCEDRKRSLETLQRQKIELEAEKEELLSKMETIAEKTKILIGKYKEKNVKLKAQSAHDSAEIQRLQKIVNGFGAHLPKPDYLLGTLSLCQTSDKKMSIKSLSKTDQKEPSETTKSSKSKMKVTKTSNQSKNSEN